MKKVLITSLLVILVAILGNYYYQKHKNQSQGASTQTAQQSREQKSEEQPEVKSNTKTYNLEEVAQHGPENPDYENLPLNESCWIIIRDKVYAIPDNFTETHPGGHAIYEGCGTDATTLFETRPSGSGTPHSADARKILETFYIGDLKK